MRWKWIVLGLFALVAVVVVAGYAVIMSYDWNQLKPYVAQRVEQATGRKLTLAGDIQLAVGLRPRLVVNQASLANAAWGSRPEMIQVKRLEASVSLIPLLSGQVEINRLELVEPDILIEVNKQGVSNLALGPKPASPGAKDQAKAAPKQPKPSTQGSGQDGGPQMPAVWLESVVITGGSLRYENRVTGEQRAGTVESLEADAPSPDSPVQLSLKGVMGGHPLELKGKLGSLKALETGPWPVDMTGRVVSAEISLKGSLAKPLEVRGVDLAVQAKGDDLAKALPRAGLKGPFSLKAQVTDPKPRVYRFADLELGLGDNSVTGALRVTLTGSRPYFQAKLASTKLDLRPLLAKGGEKSAALPWSRVAVLASRLGPSPAWAASQGGSGHGSGDRVFSSEPLPLEGLTAIDAYLALEAQELILPWARFGQFDLEAGLNDGGIKVKHLQAKMAGGDLEARAGMSPQGKDARVNLSLKLAGAESGAILEQAGASKVVDGPLEVLADFTGQGGSMAAIMASLEGRLAAVVEKGRINNRYLDLLGGDLIAVLDSLSNPGNLSKDYTPMNCLVVGAKAHEGMARTTALLLNTENMVVLGEGDINLKTEALNLSFHPQPKKGAVEKATDDKVSLSLAHVSRPFALGGTLARPKVTLDKSQLISTIAKAVGGFAALGPAGAAAAALTSVDAGAEAGCEPAIKAAREGVKFKPRKSGGAAGEAEKDVEQGEEKAKTDIERGADIIKGLLGQ